MKESIVQQCLEILKREDVKNECKAIFKPILDFVLYELKPYIYITVTLVFVIFFMNLATLIVFLLMLRNKSFLQKILG